MIVRVTDERFNLKANRSQSHGITRLGGEGTVRRGNQVEVLDKSLQERIGLFARQVKETDREVLEVSPTLDVLVVQVVVYAVVGLERVRLNRSHGVNLF